MDSLRIETAVTAYLQNPLDTDAGAAISQDLESLLQFLSDNMMRIDPHDRLRLYPLTIQAEKDVLVPFLVDRLSAEDDVHCLNMIKGIVHVVVPPGERADYLSRSFPTKSAYARRIIDELLE